MATSSTDDNTTTAVESPCINVCTLDADDLCIGCYRNIDEICAWGSADNAERRQIVAAAGRRREISERCA
jgi:hypothetical protein